MSHSLPTIRVYGPFGGGDFAVLNGIQSDLQRQREFSDYDSNNSNLRWSFLEKQHVLNRKRAELYFRSKVLTTLTGLTTVGKQVNVAKNHRLDLRVMVDPAFRQNVNIDWIHNEEIIAGDDTLSKKIRKEEDAGEYTCVVKHQDKNNTVIAQFVINVAMDYLCARCKKPTDSTINCQFHAIPPSIFLDRYEIPPTIRGISRLFDMRTIRPGVQRLTPKKFQEFIAQLTNLSGILSDELKSDPCPYAVSIPLEVQPWDLISKKAYVNKRNKTRLYQSLCVAIVMLERLNCDRKPLDQLAIDLDVDSKDDWSDAGSLLRAIRANIRSRELNDNNRVYLKSLDYHAENSTSEELNTKVSDSQMTITPQFLLDVTYESLTDYQMEQTNASYQRMVRMKFGFSLSTGRWNCCNREKSDLGCRVAGAHTSRYPGEYVFHTYAKGSTDDTKEEPTTSYDLDSKDLHARLQLESDELKQDAILLAANLHILNNTTWPPTDLVESPSETNDIDCGFSVDAQLAHIFERVTDDTEHWDKELPMKSLSGFFMSHDNWKSYDQNALDCVYTRSFFVRADVVKEYASEINQSVAEVIADTLKSILSEKEKYLGFSLDELASGADGLMSSLQLYKYQAELNWLDFCNELDIQSAKTGDRDLFDVSEQIRILSERILVDAGKLEMVLSANLEDAINTSTPLVHFYRVKWQQLPPTDEEQKIKYELTQFDTQRKELVKTVSVLYEEFKQSRQLDKRQQAADQKFAEAFAAELSGDVNATEEEEEEENEGDSKEQAQGGNSIGYERTEEDRAKLLQEREQLEQNFAVFWKTFKDLSEKQQRKEQIQKDEEQKQLAQQPKDLKAMTPEEYDAYVNDHAWLFGKSGQREEKTPLKSTVLTPAPTEDLSVFGEPAAPVNGYAKETKEKEEKEEKEDKKEEETLRPKSEEDKKEGKRTTKASELETKQPIEPFRGSTIRKFQKLVEEAKRGYTRRDRDVWTLFDSAVSNMTLGNVSVGFSELIKGKTEADTYGMDVKSVLNVFPLNKSKGHDWIPVYRPKMTAAVLIGRSLRSLIPDRERKALFATPIEEGQPNHGLSLFAKQTSEQGWLDVYDKEILKQTSAESIDSTFGFTLLMSKALALPYSGHNADADKSVRDISIAMIECATSDAYRDFTMEQIDTQAKFRESAVEHELGNLFKYDHPTQVRIDWARGAVSVKLKEERKQLFHPESVAKEFLKNVVREELIRRIAHRFKETNLSEDPALLQQLARVPSLVFDLPHPESESKTNANFGEDVTYECYFAVRAWSINLSILTPTQANDVNDPNNVSFAAYLAQLVPRDDSKPARYDTKVIPAALALPPWNGNPFKMTE